MSLNRQLREFRAELARLAGPPVSAAEVLGRAEALYRGTDPAELDYAGRIAAADLRAAAAGRCR